MIINKSSLDRGFAHGTLIKTETVDLTAAGKGSKVRENRDYMPLVISLTSRFLSSSSAGASPARGTRGSTIPRWAPTACRCPAHGW
jgi:hypothetical protein